MLRFDTPKAILWWIAVTIGLIGIASTFIYIPLVSGYAFWFVAVGFVLLVIATF